jgi:hypothetical protein
MAIAEQIEIEDDPERKTIDSGRRIRKMWDAAGE